MRGVVNAWKIAPGDGADDWPVFLKHRCVGLGWLSESNYRDFDSPEDALKVLELEYGDKKTCRGGAAKMICQFVQAVRPNDIIVANRGYDTVVGIGVVKGEYLPPRSPRNPLRHDETTHRHHVRCVDWLVSEEVRLPDARFFVQSTLWQLPLAKFAQVVIAYLDLRNIPAATKDRLWEMLDLVLPAVGDADPLDELPAKRVQTTVCRVVRDTRLARLVKLMHDHVCQDCGRTIEIPGGGRYAESHHIKPLGKPHDGPDVMSNILCLCPTCHTEYDLGVKSLSLPGLTCVAGHDVDERFIRYHNTRICRPQ